MDNPRHKLDDASRLNYAKQYTIEHNVKIWFIGRISSDSEWRLRTDFNKVHSPLEIKGYRPPDMTDDAEDDAEDNAEAYTYNLAPTYTDPYYQQPVESEYRGANSSSQYMTAYLPSPESATGYSHTHITPAYTSTSARHSIKTIPEESETEQTRDFSTNQPDQDSEVLLRVTRQEEDTEPPTVRGQPDSPADVRDQQRDPINNPENESNLPTSSRLDGESVIPLESRSRNTLSHPAKYSGRPRE